MTPARPTPVFPPAPADLKHAVERGLALMEKTSHGFFVNGACVSCHLHGSAGPMLLERVDGGGAPLA